MSPYIKPTCLRACVCRCRVLVCLCVFTQTSLSEITKVPVARAAFKQRCLFHPFIAIDHSRSVFRPQNTQNAHIEIQHSVLHTRRCMYKEHTHARVRSFGEREKKNNLTWCVTSVRKTVPNKHTTTHTQQHFSYANCEPGGKIEKFPSASPGGATNP